MIPNSMKEIYMDNINTLEKSNIYFLNSESILSNIKNICNLYNKENVSTTQSSKASFFDTLNRLQGFNIPYKEDEIIIKFNDDDIINHLVNKKVIERGDLKDNKHLFKDEEQKNIRDNINKALQLLNVLHPDLTYLIKQLTGTIIFFKKSSTGGGTTSCALGLIWLNPHKDWTIIDYADALYHEFTHTSIFIDDMVNRMFLDAKACKDPKAYVTSAILKFKRPLDSAYHAAGVAVALMHFYHMLSNKQKALSFLDPLKITINELMGKKEYLGERGIDTLNGMSDFINNLDYENIHLSLKLNN
ncbi:aKG-HExxH-type peptide beta-hydroxylase [Staphylococcus aureus]|uniref:aKG-HExxH-type peptide beta-hydroxylase n=1 Tax=Staphylococcus aureus TaxID=1280 RepID=UPI0021759E04|nr:HEXXH motif-containing putative peptide modification protein [Staphylococcus aureus]MCS5193380.1 HEXXH motif-containing putative peptide modification protein [Staphylococcus aureus]